MPDTSRKETERWVREGEREGYFYESVIDARQEINLKETTLGMAEAFGGPLKHVQKRHEQVSYFYARFSLVCPISIHI